MESLSNFMLFAAVVNLIIAIVLIFKFLIMAADIREIKKQHDLTHYQDWKLNFNMLLAHGYKQEAKRLLLSQVWNSSEAVQAICYDYEEKYNELKKIYGPYYSALGEKFPDFSELMKKFE